MQTLTFKLMPKIDDGLKADVVKWSAFYEHRIRMGSVRLTNLYSYFMQVCTDIFVESHLPPGSVRSEVYAPIRRVCLFE